MKVLVTGAAGFIGSHVSEALLRRGDLVVGFDNVNDYYSTRQKWNNIDLLKSISAGSFSFVEADLRDRPAVASVIQDNAFEVIVHLGAMAGVRASLESPGLYYEVNLGGTLNILEALRPQTPLNDGAVPRVIFGSTSSVYGETTQIPFVESDPCDRPLSPYAASKRAAEMLGFSYHRLYGVKFTILRFFTVYGPRGRPDMMAFKLADHLFHGRALTLYNGGDMFRDWTYVSDVVQGVLAAIDARLAFDIINLGRGEPIRLGTFVKEMESLTGRKARLVDGTMPPADIRYTFADISRAGAVLGYDPRVSVREGLKRFLAWYELTNGELQKS